MEARLLRLFPEPSQEMPLVGTYLAHELHKRGTPAAPFVYGSFVSSLDGRIAMRDQGGSSYVPRELTSRDDFRLFLELQAQADCLITNAGYLRALAEGRLDDVLQIGLRSEAHDLTRWRVGRGLAPQPAVAIASASLKFPVPPSLAEHGQRVLIATGDATPAYEIDRIRAEGYEVIRAGKGRAVDGAPLVRSLGSLGFRNLYLLAGPRMLDAMLRDAVLARLYLTIIHRVLGGEAFHTMSAGGDMGWRGRLAMKELYYDAAGPDGMGQLFACFEQMAQRNGPAGLAAP
jgi:riboflavin biosynthesis pyrimidine reductase